MENSNFFFLLKGSVEENDIFFSKGTLAPVTLTVFNMFEYFEHSV